MSAISITIIGTVSSMSSSSLNDSSLFHYRTWKAILVADQVTCLPFSPDGRLLQFRFTFLSRFSLMSRQCLFSCQHNLCRLRLKYNSDVNAHEEYIQQYCIMLLSISSNFVNWHNWVMKNQSFKCTCPCLFWSQKIVIPKTTQWGLTKNKYAQN